MNNDDTSWVGRRAGDVTLLSGRVPPAGRSALQEIEEHWRELQAASDHLPRREDVDTGRIAGALPHTFVLERIAPGHARFRVAGRSLVELLGGEARGLPLSVLFSPKGREGLAPWVQRCLEGPALVDLLVEASQGALRQPLRGRLLMLPLLDPEGAATRILGGLLTDSTPRSPNLRFDLADAVPRVETVAPRAVARQAFGMAPGMSARPGLRESERPYLRLVVSNP
jgi:hypothetical protein